MFDISSQEVVRSKASAVVYISVEDKDGISGIGTGFHIGDGYIVTARHVIKSKKICNIGRNSIFINRKKTANQVHETSNRFINCGEIVEGPFNHPDPNVDISLLRLGCEIETIIQLDPSIDKSDETDILMREVILMGYPPIPTSSEPNIVMFRGDISAKMTSYLNKMQYFVISGMARGGFSGGPILQTKHPGASIGIITESLIKNSQATEFGFVCGHTTSVIFETIDHHRLIIDAIQKSYNGLIV